MLFGGGCGRGGAESEGLQYLDDAGGGADDAGGGADDGRPPGDPVTVGYLHCSHLPSGWLRGPGASKPSDWDRRVRVLLFLLGAFFQRNRGRQLFLEKGGGRYRIRN